MPDDRLNRRLFFRRGLGELLKPITKAAAPLEEVIRQLGSMDDDAERLADATPAKPKKTGLVGGFTGGWIRPPGALAEQPFRETCSRCGDCVKVCPVKCIKIDPTGGAGAGAPFIDVATNPCVMCAGLQCMHVCPTGALVPTPIADVDMGTAEWNPATCLRTFGEPCEICVDECPIGEVAIRLDGPRVAVQDGCTGCGSCQFKCPTTPNSIVVSPSTSGPIAGVPRPR